MWTLHKLRTRKRKREEELSQAPIQPSSSAEPAPHLISADAAPGAAPGLREAEPWIVSPWDFSQEDLAMFPALCRRNFWCIQRHQARGECCAAWVAVWLSVALHYDLRMQLDGTTMSWAVPRGLLGESEECGRR